MFEVVLGSDKVSLDPRMPVHDAIRAVLQRSLRFTPPCRCTDPWLRVYVADTWRDGKLELTQVQACCEAQRRAAVMELPPSMMSAVQSCGPRLAPSLPGCAFESSMRLLLDDCDLDGQNALSNGVLVVPKDRQPRGLSACSRHDSLLVCCEVPFMVNGTRVESLLVRPLYQSPSLREALREFAPVAVVAYWRRYGFNWTPRSLVAAERFGIGVGGSMTARLTRLFPDVTPKWLGGTLYSAAQGP